MRGASIALGACGGVVLGVLGVVGPGGLDAKLYWDTPSTIVRAATPESWARGNALEAQQGALVAAERGQADAASGEPASGEVAIDEMDEGTGERLGADEVSPPASPETSAPETASTGAASSEPDTFPPLSADLQERFKNAWFRGEREGVRQVELGEPEAAPQSEASGSEQAQPEGAEPVQGYEEASVMTEYAPEAPTPAQAPVIATPPYQIVNGYPLELQRMDREGTDPNFDPFYRDAVRFRQAYVDREGGAPQWYGIPSSAAWTGSGTTGGATTGGATTGAATTGGATTGGATTGAATTGGATTGGATTGGAWTGGAWTGGAWTGASSVGMGTR